MFLLRSSTTEDKITTLHFVRVILNCEDILYIVHAAYNVLILMLVLTAINGVYQFIEN